MPTPITLEDAIAELQRIGPVYDAAIRVSDLDLQHGPSLRDELARRIKLAEPDKPSLRSGWETRGEGWPDTDWDDLVPDE